MIKNVNYLTRLLLLLAVGGVYIFLQNNKNYSESVATKTYQKQIYYLENRLKELNLKLGTIKSPYEKSKIKKEKQNYLLKIVNLRENYARLQNSLMYVSSVSNKVKILLKNDGIDKTIEFLKNSHYDKETTNYIHQHIFLFTLYRIKGKYKEAVKEFEKIYKLSSDPDAIISYATLLQEQKDYKKSIKVYRKLLINYNNFLDNNKDLQASVYINLSYSLNKIGKRIEAKKYFDDALYILDIYSKNTLQYAYVLLYGVKELGLDKSYEKKAKDILTELKRQTNQETKKINILNIWKVVYEKIKD